MTRGGSGVVERALDRFTGKEVVVKWITAVSAADLERIRREITSLRWLRLPGVVRSLHDGHDSFGWYIVMERVDGTPFPGVRIPAPWSLVEGPAIDLLRVLGRVHSAGILHADLKPGNVLVTADGRVVVLDFGISVWASLPVEERAGTPGFMAPEVREGRRDERSDLFSVGVMLSAALTGQPGPVPRGAAPPEVLALIAELTDPDPERRPPSAEAVLARLGVSSQPNVPAGQATEEQLRGLFAGPEEFLHLQTEGARVLFERTGGRSGAVAAELARWVSEGVAYPVEDRLRVRPEQLEAQEEREEETRLRGLLAEGASPSSIIEEALSVAEWWMDSGRPRRATAVLERALRTAREAGLADREAQVLEAWTVAALSQESIEAVNLAICEIRRSTMRTMALDDYESVLRAFESYLEGRPSEMQDQLASLGQFRHEALDAWRMALRVRLARTKDREEETLLSIEGWANTPGKRSRWMGWMGNLRYQQGRFAEAAALHLESAPARPTRGAWLSAMQNAAQALLEVPDLDRAREIGRTILAESRTGGLAYFELLACRVIRAADYRAGVALEPAPHLVDAAAFIHPTAEGILAVGEATIAWRAGDVTLAGALAARGEAAYRTANINRLASFSRALAYAFRGADGDRWSELLADPQGMIRPHRMQALALACRSVPSPNPAWAREVLAWVESIPDSRRSLRLDLLSPSECAEACRGL